MTTRAKVNELAEGVVWEEPPQNNRMTYYPGVWLERLAPLKKHPGQWARLGLWPSRGSATSIQQRLKNRKVQIPDGQWEFIVRKLDGQGIGLYARYIGKGK